MSIHSPQRFIEASLIVLNGRLAQRLFVVLCVLLFTIVAVRYSHKAQAGRGAFCRWRSQLLQLQHGVDLSARFNYPNPPIMAVLLEPLARLPQSVGAHAWFALQLTMAGLSLWLVRRLVESEALPFPPVAWMLVVLCSLKPIIDELTHGNVNLFLFFLIMVALTAYRRDRQILAGGLLGLAIACKLTPALFVPYFAWKRSWKVLAGVSIGMVLFLYPGVVPSLRLGMEHNQQQLASWYRVMVHPFVVEGKVTSVYLNQSLPGLATRLLSEQPSLVFWVGDQAVPARHDNLLALSPRQVQWLVKGCLVLFVLTVVLCCRASGDESGWRHAAEFAVILLGMLLFSERTWKHHAVSLMLVYACIIHRLWHIGRTTADTAVARWLFLASVVLVIFCGLGGGSSREEVASDPGLAKLALIYGGYTWAFVFLLAALVLLMRPSRIAGASFSWWRIRLTEPVRRPLTIAPEQPGPTGATCSANARMA